MWVRVSTNAGVVINKLDFFQNIFIYRILMMCSHTVSLSDSLQNHFGNNNEEVSEL